MGLPRFATSILNSRRAFTTTSTRTGSGEGFTMLDRLVSSPYSRLLALSVGVQWAGWGLASYLHTEKFYDLVGSGTFLLVSGLAYRSSSGNLRQKVVALMVGAWALRLGTFLFARVLKVGEDKRFDVAKHDPTKFFIFWTIQGFWVFVTLIPTIMLMTAKRNPILGLRDVLGWTAWGTGFLMEVVADAQKWNFKSDPANQGRFITSGLWGVSRHPNYFGEMLLWSGIFLSCSKVMRGPQLLAVLSPVMVMLLITQISGIPLLEAAGKERWGGDPEYQRYISEVPVLVPFLKGKSED